MPSSSTSSSAGNDAAARKTVSCEVLEAAFAKNPHPDGKTMSALAERLKLNKKQVSNFFERERRKANIVIESRRKGGNGSGGSSNGSVNGSAAKASGATASNSAKKGLSKTQQQPSPSSNDDARTVVSASAKKASPQSVSGGKAIALKQRQTSENDSSSALANKRRTRAVVKKDSYYRAFDDDDDYEEEEDAEGEDDDFDAAEVEEYEDEATAPAVVAVERIVAAPTRSLVEQYQEQIEHVQEQQQNPLVQKNKDEAYFNRTGGGASSSSSSRYASRNARYASRSPLYAFPAAQAPDNFRTAPIPPEMRRTASASPSVASRRSCSPLTAGTGHAQSALLPAFGYASKNLAPPGINTAKSEGARGPSLTDEDGSACGSLKRKRSARLSESPTVMFLRNPFPAPVPFPSQFPLRPEATRQASFQSMLEDEPTSDMYGDAAEFAAATDRGNISLDAYQPIFRKRARVWFSKPSGEGESNDLSQDSIVIASSQESVRARTGRSAVDAAQPVNSEPRTSRTAIRREAKARSDAASDLEGEESSDESAFGDDGGVKPKKKDNRPGAALRTNIACKELKQAFVSNPHPPADVLEALAARLGLGKKQVSNYFVRERKKAGYTIKIRHGLHRRRGPNKKKLDKPAVVVTQHDVNTPFDSNEMMLWPQAVTEANVAALEGEEDSDDDGASDLGSQMDDMAIDISLYTSHSGGTARDDVPDLAYDEQELASATLHTFEDNSRHTSSLMAPSKSMESMTTSSRQDEDEELASPPFEAVHLPPPDASHKTSGNMHPGLLSYESHVLPASSALQYL